MNENYTAVNNHNNNISNEFCNLFDKSARTIKLCFAFNYVVTFVVSCIVIINCQKVGFNNYHTLLIQLIILNIIFVSVIRYTINTTQCGIIRILNIQNQMCSSYNILHSDEIHPDNNI